LDTSGIGSLQWQVQGSLEVFDPRMTAARRSLVGLVTGLAAGQRLPGAIIARVRALRRL
jgi:hypothetical protein